MISGQVIAITGASSGIGRATALELANHGAKLVLGARHEDALVRITEEVRAAGGEATYRMTDVSKREDLLKLVQLASESYGRLDVLFSNAGAMPIGPLDELAVDDWETMVESQGRLVWDSGGASRLSTTGRGTLHPYGIHGCS